MIAGPRWTFVKDGPKGEVSLQPELLDLMYTVQPIVSFAWLWTEKFVFVSGHHSFVPKNVSILLNAKVFLVKFFIFILAIWENHAEIETIQWIQAKSKNEVAVPSEECIETSDVSESEEKENSSHESSDDDSTEQEDELPVEANKFSALKEEL